MHAKTTKPRGAVTIKQVAAAADVAVGTVSRVINVHEDFDGDLRARVEKVIRGLGYRPNILAQCLRRYRGAQAAWPGGSERCERDRVRL